MRNQEASICNLEHQIGQLANVIFERQLGNLLGNTKTNPKEHMNTVSLKSGKKLGIEEKQVKEKAIEKNKEKKKDDEPNQL